MQIKKLDGYVQTCCMMLSDVDGTAAISKSIMVVGGFWSIPMKGAVDLV